MSEVAYGIIIEFTFTTWWIGSIYFLYKKYSNILIYIYIYIYKQIILYFIHAFFTKIFFLIKSKGSQNMLEKNVYVQSKLHFLINSFQFLFNKNMFLFLS